MLFEMCVFPMLGCLMFCSKIAMELLPNIHMLGMLTVVYTLVFRVRALIPIYIYVFINGLYAGFNLWWLPYLYIWAILWGAVMLLPKKMPERGAPVIYTGVCALHGLLFGLLYAPAEALMFKLDFGQALLWYLKGVPYDLLHMVGNFAVGLLIYPLYKVLERLVKKAY